MGVTCSTLTGTSIVEEYKDFRKVYDIEQLIREENSYNVYEVRKKETGSPDSGDGRRASHRKSKKRDRVYTLKEIDLETETPLMMIEMYKEIDLLHTLHHPNIIHPIELYEDEQNRLAIVTELCCGGNLRERSPYSEIQAHLLLKQIVDTVHYLHKHKIVHRDLRPEVFRFHLDDPQCWHIKLVDLSLAITLNRKHTLQSGVGPLLTMSPQALGGNLYTTQDDMWSVGVIAYELLTSKLPFEEHPEEEIASKSFRGDFDFSGAAWGDTSEKAQQFVRNLLKVDPGIRFSAEQALKHPWLTNVPKK